MRKVRVNFTEQEGVWAARSEEFPDWLLVADTCEEAVALAEEGLEFFADEAISIVPVIEISLEHVSGPIGLGLGAAAYQQCRAGDDFRNEWTPTVPSLSYAH